MLELVDQVEDGCVPYIEVILQVRFLCHWHKRGHNETHMTKRSVNT